MITSTVLAAILRLGVADADPTLLEPVALAIVRAARTADEQAALVALGWHESRYARHVLEGRCADGPRGARCDPDADGRPRAAGPWQVWGWCSAAHGPPTQETLDAGARCVLASLRSGLRACAHVLSPWAGAFASLRGGRGSARCEWAPAGRRVETMQRVRRWL